MAKLQMIILLLLALNGLVKADICFPSFEKDSANADVIFIGKVLEINKDAYLVDQMLTSIFTFEIVARYRGTQDNTISILSPLYGCCSPHFEQDSVYIVFATKYGEQPAIYGVNSCSATALLSEYPEYAIRLGPSTKPRPFDMEEYLQDRRHSSLRNYADENTRLVSLNRQLKEEITFVKKSNWVLLILSTLLTLVVVRRFFISVRRKH
jgi:hypothetical protein